MYALATIPTVGAEPSTIVLGNCSYCYVIDVHCISYDQKRH